MIYGATLGTAIIGGGLSILLNAPSVIKLVSAVVPGALAYSAGKSVQQTYMEEYEKAKIDSYIEQLKPYKRIVHKLAGVY